MEPRQIWKRIRIHKNKIEGTPILKLVNDYRSKNSSKKFIVVCWAYIILVHSQKTFWAVHTRFILKNTNSKKLWPIKAGRIEGKAAARLSKLWLWDDIFFCKCADSTSHYLAKQLWGLEKPIWPSSKFDSENDDEMKSKAENMVFQIPSQIYLTHGFFVFETIIIFLTHFTPFFSGKVFLHKKFLEKLWHGLRSMLRFCLCV